MDIPDQVEAWQRRNTSWLCVHMCSPSLTLRQWVRSTSTSSQDTQLSSIGWSVGPYSCWVAEPSSGLKVKPSCWHTKREFCAVQPCERKQWHDERLGGVKGLGVRNQWIGESMESWLDECLWWWRGMGKVWRVCKWLTRRVRIQWVGESSRVGWERVVRLEFRKSYFK